LQWKDGIVSRLNRGVGFLLQKNKVRVIRGRAEILDGKTIRVETDAGAEVIVAEHLVLATGSEPVELTSLPFGGNVISSSGALALSEIPERLVVVGAGYIGLELGIAYAKLGSRVTIVEVADRILPTYDAELTQPVRQRLKDLGVEVMTGSKAVGLSADGRALQVETAGSVAAVPADKILVAVGRVPRTSGFGLETLGLTMKGRFIDIDRRCATSMRNVWAVGDVTGEPMLAHRAMAQGEMVAEIMAGRRRAFDKVAIPAVCFTDPEIVTVGVSPEEAAAAGHEVHIGRFPFQANGRAMSRQAEQGFVRVVARADNHVLLGIQAVGGGCSELAAAFGLAVEMGARVEDITGTVHAHPTLGEAFLEASLSATGEALHI
jgi:dihydrolipoamide dehydrogenase